MTTLLDVISSSATLDEVVEKVRDMGGIAAVREAEDRMSDDFADERLREQQQGICERFDALFNALDGVDVSIAHDDSCVPGVQKVLLEIDLMRKQLNAIEACVQQIEKEAQFGEKKDA